jgi:hypothetical protein
MASMWSCLMFPLLFDECNTWKFNDYSDGGVDVSQQLDTMDVAPAGSSIYQGAGLGENCAGLRPSSER